MSLQYALIPPSSLVPQWDCGTISFGLSHEIQKDSRLKSYYSGLRREGRFWILDNGADELGIGLDNSSELVSLIKECNPSEFILPDVIDDGKLTLLKGEAFLDQNVSRLDPTLSYMGVVQATSFSEFVDNYLFWIRERRCSSIGISYNYHFDDIPSEYRVTLGSETKALACASRRLSVLKWINISGVVSKPLHMLGTNDILEFSLLRLLHLEKNVRSTDTTAPFAATQSGVSFEGPMPHLLGDKNWDKLDFRSTCWSPKNFEDVSSPTASLLAHNMNLYRRAVTGE